MANIVWTKAEGHTYDEALALLQRYTRFGAAELDAFLAANPGDIYRVPEAFDVNTGGVDPGGSMLSNPTPLPVPVVMASGAGFLPAQGGNVVLTGEITSGSMPQSATHAENVSGQFLQPISSTTFPTSVQTLSSSSGAVAPRGFDLKWLLYAAAAIALYYAVKKGGR